MTAGLLRGPHTCQRSKVWRCAARCSPHHLARRAGRSPDLTSMITMTEWEEDMGDVARKGEAKNARAQNLRELFKRADLDGCEVTGCLWSFS